MKDDKNTKYFFLLSEALFLLVLCSGFPKILNQLITWESWKQNPTEQTWKDIWSDPRRSRIRAEGRQNLTDHWSRHDSGCRLLALPRHYIPIIIPTIISPLNPTAKMFNAVQPSWSLCYTLYIGVQQFIAAWSSWKQRIIARCIWFRIISCHSPSSNWPKTLVKLAPGFIGTRRNCFQFLGEIHTFLVLAAVKSHLSYMSNI